MFYHFLPHPHAQIYQLVVGPVRQKKLCLGSNALFFSTANRWLETARETSRVVNGRSQRLLERGPPPNDPSEPNPPPFQCDITRVLQADGRRFTNYKWRNHWLFLWDYSP